VTPEAERLLRSATVDLDFERAAYRNGSSNGDILTDFVTTTRASVGYAENTAGVWAAFGTNVPRRTDKGLLVEEARTNGIRNNSMQGAVAGTPGTIPTNWAQNIGAGITRTIVGTGTSLGINYIDVRYAGTLSAGTQVVALFFDSTTGIAATTGQIWTLSGFVALVGGSVANLTAVTYGWNENTSGGAFVSNKTGPNFRTSLTASLQRGSYSTANTGGGTVAAVMPWIQITAPTSTVVDVTLRIGWPQMELGTWATSPIRTTTAAVTRAAEVVTLTTPPTFGASFSMVGEGTPQAPSAYTAQQYLCQVDNGNNNNRETILRNNGTGNAFGYIASGGVALLSLQPAAWAQNVVGMLAVAGAANDYATSFNGSAPLISAVAGSMPAISTVRIGSTLSGGQPWNGWINRIAIWPETRLGNTDLQTVTGAATGAITEAMFTLDATPLDVPLYALDSVVVSPSVISASDILVELDAYTLPSGPIRKLYFGSTAYSDPTAPGFYEERMQQPFSFRRDIFSGNTTGGPSRVSFGEMRLANGDGGLDNARTAYAFAGWPARMMIGDVRQPYATWETLIAGKPQQALFTLNDLSVVLRDRLQDFALTIQTNKYKGDNVLPGGLEGLSDIKDRPKPLLFGAVMNISPILVNTAKLIWQVNDGPVGMIGAVYDKGIALTQDWDYANEADMIANEPLPGTYRVWLAGGYFRLGAAPSGTITCDAREYVSNPECTAAQVALRIARRPPETGEPPIMDADINWSDVAQLDRLNAAVVGIWLSDETTFSAAIDLVLSSIGAWYGFDRLGFFRLQRLDLPLGPGTVTFRRFGPDAGGEAALGEFDLLNIRFLPTNDPDRGVPTDEVKVDYGRNYTVQTGDALTGNVSTERKNFVGLANRTAVATDPTLKDAYPSALKKRVQTVLLNEWDATAEAQRLIGIYSDQRDFIEIDTPMLSDLIPMIDIGSEIKLVYPRYNYDVGRVLRVIGMQYNALNRTMTIGAWG
jgi:hypothetical protein